MNAPTPAEARFAPRFPPPFFDRDRTPGPPTVGQRRARARDEATTAVESLAKALTALRADARETDLDLHLEGVLRRMARVRAALDALDAALADPGGPPPPAPARRAS